MDELSVDPKAGERAYYQRLGEEGRQHARGKPWSDPDCARYLADFAAILHLLGPKPQRVLDLGCGTGWTSRLLAQAGHRVVGVDLAADAVALANADRPAHLVGALEYRAGDFEADQGAGEFDCVLFYDALHHAEDERLALAAAYHALRPGGLLIAVEPGTGHSQSEEAKEAVRIFGVHEKDMPPKHIWRHARAVGFQRHVALPLPRESMKTLFRRDYLRAEVHAVWERLWSWVRLGLKLGRSRRAGMILIWK